MLQIYFLMFLFNKLVSKKYIFHRLYEDINDDQMMWIFLWVYDLKETIVLKIHIFWKQAFTFLSW